MKDKILYLILGILIGAVITAGCFLVFSKNVKHDMMGERPNFEDRELPEDGNFEKGNRMREGKNGTRNPEMESNSNQVDSEV